MSNGILVFIENKGGTANRSSFEAIAAAQSFGSQLQQPVSAVVLGADATALAQEISGYDIARVICVNDPKLAEYTPDAYADALEQVVKQTDPSLIFLTHTYQVRDFAPKLITTRSVSPVASSSGNSTPTFRLMVKRRCLQRSRPAPIVPTRRRKV